MEKIKIRKIIMVAVLLISIISLCFLLYVPYKNSIAEQKKEKYYSENDVKKLEYILTKYYENEYSDEDIEKMALFYIINTYENKFYYYSDKNANEIINVLITHIKEDKEDYSHDFGFNDHFIKKGDYHELAVALMESYNDTIIDNNISDNLEEIDSMGEICIFTIFTIVYIYFIFKFTFLNLFDKNTYAKSIIKYAIIIFSIYVSNIIVCIIFEKVINSFEYYQSFNLANIEDYGTFDLTFIISVLIISILLNALLNIKNIIAFFKQKNNKKI